MKTLKRILPLMLAFTLLCFAFAGCGSSKATYFEITVTFEDGTPVNGLTDGDAYNNGQIKVRLCTTTDDGACASPAEIDKNGKCKIKIPELEENEDFVDCDLVVHLIGADNYDYDEKIINKNSPKVTIVLKAKQN